MTRTLLYILLPGLHRSTRSCWFGRECRRTSMPTPSRTRWKVQTQTIAQGPVASQEAIKMLGTNGGGFFNANSAHPFENPTPLSNFLQILSIFIIPAGLTYTLGRMTGSPGHGWAVFAAMFVLFAAGFTRLLLGRGASASAHSRRRANRAPQLRPAAIWKARKCATASPKARCSPPSLPTPVAARSTACTTALRRWAAWFLLTNIMLGEVIFGGVGSGLYGMLIFVVLSVFIAGLMVGRTPEYLGKKIEAYDVKMAMLYVLIFPLIILNLTAFFVLSAHVGLAALTNNGPHGLTEILYAFTSGAGNNGSAFAGLNIPANPTTQWWYNIALGFDMLVGRFLMMIPVLALAGNLAQKKSVPPSPGTFPVNTSLFTVLLVGVVLILGALTFLPGAEPGTDS